MKITDRFKAFLNPQNNVMRINDSQFLDLLGVDGSSTEAISEVTYFTCLKIDYPSLNCYFEGLKRL